VEAVFQFLIGSLEALQMGSWQIPHAVSIPHR